MILLYYYFPFPVRSILSGRLSLLMAFVLDLRKDDLFPRATVSMEIKHPDLWIEAVELVR